MKKLLLSFAALIGLTTGAIAQTAELKISDAQKNISVNKTSYVLKDKKLVPSRRADVYSDWYNFTGSYEEGTLLGQKLEPFVNFIQPDTNLYTVIADGSKVKTGFHVIGSTFDPKDSNFLATSQNVLTRFNPYTVDSLIFTQSYIRQSDSTIVNGKLVSIVDTVYIQYFNIGGIKVGGYNYQANPGVTYRYATPAVDNFSTKTLLNSAAMKTDTLFLTAADADSLILENGVPKSFKITRVLLTPNVKSQSTNGANNSANLFAFSVVYKPMQKSKLGDVGIAYDGSTWMKYNLYGVILANLSGHSQEIISTNKINNMFVCNFQVRYGQTLFGFLKSYLPGTVFSNTLFFPNLLKITTPNLSTNKINSGITGIQVYPNPAASNAQVDVVFNLSANAMVKTVVTDMNGRVVLSNEAKQYVTGQNAVVVNTNGLSSGIYMVTLESAAGRMSSKLTVN
jgi:hypothetical protein